MDVYRLVLTLLTASSYVFAIYFAEPSYIKNKHRDELDVVYFRIKRIIILCILSLIIIPNIVEGKYSDNIRKLGLIPGYSISSDLKFDLTNILKSIYFILILYSSTIFQVFLGQFTLFDDDDDDTPWRVYNFRDYILAPISEELIYRGLTTLIIGDDSSLMRICPYLFGVAHLHHGYQMYAIKKQSLMKVMLTVGFQFMYTSLFGSVVLYFYLQMKNNLWSCIIMHVMCNMFGIPSFQVDASGSTKGVLLKVVYYVLIIVGLVHSYIYIRSM